MAIAVNDRLPAASFQRLTENGVITLSSEELFAGDTVVVFAVPGAFTPTCSASHLPGFVALAEQFFQGRGCADDCRWRGQVCQQPRVGHRQW